MPTVTLGGITLPRQTVWADRFSVQTHAQQVAYTVAGNPCWMATKQLGRIITLEWSENTAWLDRATAQALWDLSMAIIPVRDAALPFHWVETLRTPTGVEISPRSYSALVIFAHHQPPALDLKPIEPNLNQLVGTIKLLEV